MFISFLDGLTQLKQELPDQSEVLPPLQSLTVADVQVQRLLTQLLSLLAVVPDGVTHILHLLVTSKDNVVSQG